MSIERIRDYHAQWIAAAEKGLINYDVAMMLIDAFELGIAEARESVIRGEDISTIAESAIKQNADTRQWLTSKGFTISYAPSQVVVEPMAEVEQISSELSKIVNMRSRTLHNKFD
ncbi:hypothetical protein [Vibrio mediterranei]|uniref:hypothetical protein n=1 Tax=Vibrio mediterranei TaxID=689 RepID=UPI00148BFF43|nr:hypothetical protein [Vibrio mediterranei]NOI26718.1 hypothetical protein [Vibrio mediterranei]